MSLKLKQERIETAPFPNTPLLIMINTYNETRLHRTLKQLYCGKNDTQETPLEGYVCDIYTQQHEIIEIHTGHLQSLKKKIAALISKHPITIVYPIILNNYILLLTEKGEKKSFRKSPKHGSYFQIFRELPAVAAFLEHRNLSIKVLYIDCQTVKIDNGQGGKRYKKPQILDKILLRIEKEEHFCGLQDICRPVLTVLPDTFTRQNIKPLKMGKHTPFVLSFLKKNNLIATAGKSGRYTVYKKTDAAKAASVLYSL